MVKVTAKTMPAKMTSAGPGCSFSHRTGAGRDINCER
jgi:hypothetical protein